MAEIKTRVRISEKELKEIICKIYGLQLEKATVSVNSYQGGQRDPNYTEIIVEGISYKKSD